MIRWVIRLLIGLSKISDIEFNNLKGNFKILFLSNGERTKIVHFQSSESFFQIQHQLNVPENDFLLGILN